MTDQYMFQAGPEACDICSAMDGETSQEPMDLPHEGCECQVVPLTAGDDCPSYEVGGWHSERYGPHGESAIMYAEVEVTCCDGSTIGETIEIDMGIEPGGRTVDDEVAEWDAAVDEAAQEMASGCVDHDLPVV